MVSANSSDVVFLFFLFYFIMLL